METSISDNNKRIAKNTIFLYIRMLLVMAVSLYTSRIILKALGADDYGVYSVVGGIVSLFSIISGSLSSSISRFITFELGKGDLKYLRKIFANTLFIQIALIIAIIILILPIAIWFIGSKMNINPNMLTAAYWVLGFSVITFCINLLSVPYNAAIISHEKMAVFSFVSVIDCAIKLGISFLIMLFDSNRLVIYAGFILLSSLIVQSIYMLYCMRNFAECKTKPGYDKSLLKEIGGFASWNFIGSTSNLLRNQGNNILLNLFFGTIVNAAYAICMQVNSAVTQLSNNFMVSVNPQITKYYAQNEIIQCISLMFRSSRMSFFLTLLIASVILINTRFILHLWLITVPEDTIIFIRLILIMSLIESISIPLITGMLATGHIRDYQFIVGGLQMLNLPISYIALKCGSTASAPLFIAIGISIICLFARIIMLHKLIPFNMARFIYNVLVKDSLVVITSMAIPLLVIFFYGFAYSFISFIWQSLICLICVLISIYFIGFTYNERQFINDKILLLKHKIIR